jgi:hypothetical protein
MIQQAVTFYSGGTVIEKGILVETSVTASIKQLSQGENHDKTLMGSQILLEFDFSENCDKIFICLESSQGFQQFYREFQLNPNKTFNFLTIFPKNKS